MTTNSKASRHDAMITLTPEMVMEGEVMTHEEFTELRKKRIVTPERARLAAHRLINSHFNNPRQEHAIMSIPVNIDDDDIVIMDFIDQQMVTRERKED